MNYILATLAEIKDEIAYRMEASQYNQLERYASFGEFLTDVKWSCRAMLDRIESNKYDY
jgi:hypothetical protein